MNDEIYDGMERREYFRIRYPATDKPKLMFTSEEFDILEISEQGIKFDLEKTMHVTLIFNDGESLKIEGKFLRTNNNEIVLHPLKGIPSERISKEQRYLRGKYIGQQ